MNNITKLEVDIHGEAIRQYVQSNVQKTYKNIQKPRE